MKWVECVGLCETSLASETGSELRLENGLNERIVTSYVIRQHFCRDHVVGSPRSLQTRKFYFINNSYTFISDNKYLLSSKKLYRTRRTHINIIIHIISSSFFFYSSRWMEQCIKFLFLNRVPFFASQVEPNNVLFPSSFKIDFAHFVASLPV